LIVTVFVESSMQIKCPSCQAVLNIPPGAAGKVIKCPCGTQLRAPGTPATGASSGTAAGAAAPQRPAPQRPAPQGAAPSVGDAGLFDELTEGDMQPFGKQSQAAHKPNPYQSATSMGPSGTSHVASAAAVAKVKPVAITLLIVTSISLVLVVLDMLSRLVMGGALLAGVAPGDIGPEQEAMIWFSGIAGLIIGGIMSVCGIVIIIGSVKMMRLKSYGLAMTACILAMLPLLSPCCCIGLPVGIWGVVVLCNPQVKAAFG
jgi:hypothetical protein